MTGQLTVGTLVRSTDRNFGIGVVRRDNGPGYGIDVKFPRRPVMCIARTLLVEAKTATSEVKVLDLIDRTLAEVS